MVPPTYAGRSWIVKFFDANHLYEVSRPYLKYVCCSCPWRLWEILCKQQCAIILQYTYISESMLLEFCGTYFETKRGELGTMFDASVSEDFSGDEVEESYRV